MNFTGQLTLTDAEGRSLDLGVVEFVYGAQAGKTRALRTQAERAPVEGSVAVEIHVPRQRSPGPHPYRWPTPRRGRR